ncbi:MAG: hypothetical protein AB7G13_22545 [Lautropia sp.]
MSRSGFMAAIAIVSVIFGVAFLIAPEAVLRMYRAGATPEAAFVHICRLFGAAFLGTAVTTWLARNESMAVARPVLTGLAVIMTVGFLASLYRQFTGGPATAWINVVLYGIFGLGAFYYLGKRGDTAAG